jgi:hypothetical protein
LEVRAFGEGKNRRTRILWIFAESVKVFFGFCIVFSNLLRGMTIGVGLPCRIVATIAAIRRELTGCTFAQPMCFERAA